MKIGENSLLNHTQGTSVTYMVLIYISITCTESIYVKFCCDPRVDCCAFDADNRKLIYILVVAIQEVLCSIGTGGLL